MQADTWRSGEPFSRPSHLYRLRSASQGTGCRFRKLFKVINEKIIVRAQRGDQQAFQQLVETYHGIVWRTARLLLRDAALTDDTVQEAWIDVWRGLPRLQHHQTFRSWLLTIVTNRCRMALRRSVPLTIS